MFQRLVASGLLVPKQKTCRQLLASASRSMSTTPKQPTVLCILDGWGYNPDDHFNSVLQGHTPNFDELWGRQSQRELTAFLNASEAHVGLPEGQIGNSEVGHMNIGAGRVVYQDIMLISKTINDGELKDVNALKNHIAALKASGGTSHIMGLVSPGGVHSLQAHVAAIAREVSSNGIPVVIHAFTDGRDVPPKDAAKTMPQFLESIKDTDAKVGTVIGRYFAMDRDNRWERVSKAYKAMANAEAPNTAQDAISAIEAAHSSDQTDEFIEPTIIGDYQGMKSGDGIIMANFRSDRAREILCALADPKPSEDVAEHVPINERPQFADVTGMVTYSDVHATYMGEPLFPEKDIRLPLGEVVANAGLKQLRIAETEKYPHVTFFLNGGRENEFEGEDRIMVASPKVATYDLQPEMSAPEVGEKLCGGIRSGKYDMIICNFANPDMVGHTGSLEAAIAAVESVDKCLGDILAAVKEQNGAIIVTADHGNCEQMWDPNTQGPHTAHTLNLVPVILADYSNNPLKYKKLTNGALCDLAPTILDLLHVTQPSEMTGKSLISDK